jgi:hypothetical protein
VSKELVDAIISEHNRAAKPTSVPVVKPVEGTAVCILLEDGSLFGPFESRESAMYWAIAQDLFAYSTYDLKKP